MRYGPFDVAMIPIGAYEPRWFMESVHMNAEEGVRTYLDLCARHESAGHTEAAALPSESFWLLSHGETRKAEHHRPSRHRARHESRA